ncbi:hypothetical protein IDJ81_02325 [Tsuneonella flava]|uniref:Methyltransferase type 11 domain-containing protein n=1 Tax=Tsuneonella flava TaxID=2055955 RepID=A0ABX7K9U4_9SPHN|nr:hypothetical protein [Tsuneonella flava]QSB45023.1 hypothetical protein IDJ81_02325 [Tsuneonella flava]
MNARKKHIAAFHKYTVRSIADHVFEFGAGWDLCSALARHTLGVRKQTMVDLNRLALTWQINHVLNYISDEKISHLKDLENLGISYLAPFDARCTGLPDSSVDLICSTNTLEQIPSVDAPEEARGKFGYRR